MRKLSLVTLLCSSAMLVRADFTYMETTEMTGGSMAAMMQSLGTTRVSSGIAPSMAASRLAGKAREPMVATHIVKGNRKATITRDTATITDLDKETITTIDNVRKTYTVMTFAEMKQRMEQGMQRIEGRGKGQGGDNVQANVKMSAKATGQSKNIQGLTAKEMVITMTTEFADASSGQAGAMDMVNDSWVAPLPGYEEVRAFNTKLGAKMGAMFGSGMQQMGMMGGRGNMGQSMEQMAKEMQKLDGIPVQSLIKMMPAGGAAGSAAGPPPSASGACTADSQSAADALAGALGGRLGGLGRGKKKDDAEPSAQSPAGCNAGAGSGGSLMEMTVLLTSYSPAPVDASKFEIPAGYKQVEGPGR